MIYKEILKLKQMLDDAGILYESFMYDLFSGGFQLRLNSNIDVIEHRFSYGNDEDLLEIQGALTEEERKTDTVKGWLTAEEVFKRFKYCYEHNTSIYCEEV